MEYWLAMDSDDSLSSVGFIMSVSQDMLGAEPRRAGRPNNSVRRRASENDFKPRQWVRSYCVGNEVPFEMNCNHCQFTPAAFLKWASSHQRQVVSKSALGRTNLKSAEGLERRPWGEHILCRKRPGSILWHYTVL